MGQLMTDEAAQRYVIVLALHLARNKASTFRPISVSLFISLAYGAKQLGDEIAAPLLVQARLKVPRLEARHSEQEICIFFGRTLSRIEREPGNSQAPYIDIPNRRWNPE